MTEHCFYKLYVYFLQRKSIDKTNQSAGGDKNSNTVRAPSPSRPPPSPEPVPLPVNKPKPPDTPKAKKRGCITKKVMYCFIPKDLVGG